LLVRKKLLEPAQRYSEFTAVSALWPNNIILLPSYKQYSALYSAAKLVYKARFACKLKVHSKLRT
jgi:hypothetical protein